MDSITQIVLGAAVGEAVLGRKIGNKAMLLGAIGGTIPDLDVAAQFFTDTVTALEIHRGFTHSIVFAISFGLLFGWLCSLWDKRATLKQWWLFWFSCFVTHALLDAHTTWGTQLFWPLDIRLEYKNIFVIDPLYTIPFLIFLLIAAFHRKDNPKRRKFNNLGLIVSTSYLCLTIILKGIAFVKFKNELKTQEISHSGLMVKPSPLNSIMWIANVETEDAFLIGYYSFFDTQSVQFYEHPKNHEALGNLANDPLVQRLIKITDNWYTILIKNGEVYLNDLRFGQLSVNPETKRYAFSYLIEETDSGVRISEEVKDGRDAQKVLSDLWKRMWGN